MQKSPVSAENAGQLKDLIREIPDFPKPGILFYDITTLLKDKTGFATLIDKFSEYYISSDVDLVLGMEARGFIFAPALAYRLNAGFVPVRKPGKLPSKKLSLTYALEYGQDTLEIHEDAIKRGEKCLVVDDLLATGGTMNACCNMVETLGGNIVGIAVLIELTFLKGRDRFSKYNLHSAIKYDS